MYEINKLNRQKDDNISFSYVARRVHMCAYACVCVCGCVGGGVIVVTLKRPVINIQPAKYRDNNIYFSLQQHKYSNTVRLCFDLQFPQRNRP